MASPGLPPDASGLDGVGIKMVQLRNDPFSDVVSFDRVLMLWLDEDGDKDERSLHRRVTDVAPEYHGPCRLSPNYQHRGHYLGQYVCVATGQQVWFESLLELSCLMQLEHGGGIEAIATQPFCLVFPQGPRHYPDFCYLRSDGTRVVVDVRAKDRIREKDWDKFERTRDVCQFQGWDYEIMHGLSGWQADNLDYLGAFYRPHLQLGEAQSLRLMEFLRTPKTFAEAACFLDPETPVRFKPHLYHLIWNRKIMILSEGPIFEEMLIAASEVAS